MSVLMAVAATVQATPLPSPQVVKETLQPIIQQSPEIPASVVQLSQLLAVAGAGALTSLLHQLIERGKLSSNLNRLLFAIYGGLAGVAFAFLTGEWKLDATSVTVALTGVATFLTSSQGRYEVWKALQTLLSQSAPLAAPEEPVVATEASA